MQLYGSYTSPFVRHCRTVLLETGLKCEFVLADGSVSEARSPTQKLPFLIDGELTLTDSTAIVRHLRERAGQSFLPMIEDFDRYLMADTLMDAWVVLFNLRKDGLAWDDIRYLKRQRARIDTCLQTLEALSWPEQSPYNDLHLRVGCVLDWMCFRELVDLAAYPQLHQFLSTIRTYTPFAETAPHA
ncbi:glutathione S-transferase family protein [Marinimicrobium alkaliphilum]|uniref:glutathione S-transferase family protein n=1 Tax=Marinimicrobium alkaliphilum TaxID=2202654 RepID=UPI000DBA02CC|nr:glutathione S-transferase family protein [Marinimicrobium alkaliphilum]